MSTEIQDYYSVPEVAAKLGVSRYYVYDRVKDGSFTSVLELGGPEKQKIRISEASLKAFIRSRTHETA